MAHYAIGDLQGCHDEFLALLETLRFDPARDRLWLVGDLVNRGPDSLGVLRTVRSLGPAVTAVLGNHDLHLLALQQGVIAPGRSDAALAAVLAAPDADELLAWLGALPLAVSEPDPGWSMVHAGLPPEWTVADAVAASREVQAALARAPRDFFRAMYGDEPRRYSPALTGLDRLRFAVNCLTRLRFVSAQGELLLSLKGPPDSAPAAALPWFRHAARQSRGSRIVFGHWSALGYVREDGIVALDTGCVWGGTLTAVRLDADGDAGPVSVPAGARPGTGRVPPRP
jgi:bis(5'-nucleosyl)-tetraphosphatase (symmetrical)